MLLRVIDDDVRRRVDVDVDGEGDGEDNGGEIGLK